MEVNSGGVGRPGGLALERRPRRRQVGGGDRQLQVERGLDPDVAIGAARARLMFVGDPGPVRRPRRAVGAEAVAEVGDGEDLTRRQILDEDVEEAPARGRRVAVGVGDHRSVRRPGRMPVLAPGRRDRPAQRPAADRVAGDRQKVGPRRRVGLRRPAADEDDAAVLPRQDRARGSGARDQDQPSQTSHEEHPHARRQRAHEPSLRVFPPHAIGGSASPPSTGASSPSSGHITSIASYTSTPPPTASTGQPLAISEAASRLAAAITE